MATVVNMEFQTCLEVVLGVDKLVLDNKCFVSDPIQIKDQCHSRACLGYCVSSHGPAGLIVNREAGDAGRLHCGVVDAVLLGLVM